ncbi:hypothetical protein NEMBOFW57_008560 [Staphylotrichum longicolle]|uniref:Heterokaryon incompatibility domain-containing protein n=1 Tax=Staphylotrichum longicolle TaxID=669026 RepID=A0AAD4EVV0_9PEZI|nr:hypothetical protein NEMBOFW57_008560 [Staphylotrichum longicolle]
MSRWHRASCRRPDVYFVGGVPFCSACDASPDHHSIDPDASPGIPPAPELPTGGLRNLSWPLSVRYWNDADYDSTSGENLTAASNPAVSSLAVPAVAQSASHGVYAPLEQTNHVRLLQLSKGNFDDPIHGTLIISSLDDGPNFEALSYAWADETGDDSRRKIIFLDRSWNTFKVTANCFAALRRMRNAKKDILVWVDAVCIDQGNHAERNHQVGLMARIYSSARELFVYLGEGDKELEAALLNLTWSKQAKSIDPELIRRLFQCRYFSRMWIIQEVANAMTANIHYGASSIRWAILSENRLLPILGDDVVQSIPRWVTTIYNQPKYSVADLPHLLLNTAHSEAADTRDHVFALFGLLRDAADHVLTADYALANPHGHLWTLDFAIGTNTEQLPTWVPDWRAVQRGPKIVERSAVYGQEAANGGSEADVSPCLGSPDGDIKLGVRILKSGRLIIPVATLMTADDFPLYWARSAQDPPLAWNFGQFQFSVAGIQGVPPGKIQRFAIDALAGFLDATLH